MKILNLYAGIGGNRKLWGDEHDITAVEKDPNIAKIYQDFFPNDKVVVADAHKYLEEHYNEFDFIWSSPPCPSHSSIRKSFSPSQNKPIFPDMKLYEEILFLQGYFKGKWVVENVISWYDPLIEPYTVGSHFYWSNFIIYGRKRYYRGHYADIETLEKIKGFSVKGYNINEKKALRNCVEPEMGLHIFNCAFKKQQGTLL